MKQPELKWGTSNDISQVQFVLIKHCFSIKHSLRVFCYPQSSVLVMLIHWNTEKSCLICFIKAISCSDNLFAAYTTRDNLFAAYTTRAFSHSVQTKTNFTVLVVCSLRQMDMPWLGFEVTLC